MIVIPLFDVFLLVINVIVAVLNRGTVWGWLATAFVLWQTWTLIKFIRD